MWYLCVHLHAFNKSLTIYLGFVYELQFLNKCVVYVGRLVCTFWPMHFVIISTCCNNNKCNVNSKIVLLLVCMFFFTVQLYNTMYIMKQVCVWLWKTCKCIRYRMIALHLYLFSMSLSVIYLFIENENNLCGFFFIFISSVIIWACIQAWFEDVYDVASK